MKNNFGPSNWNADEIQNVARDDPIQLPNTGGWEGGGVIQSFYKIASPKKLDLLV